MGSTAINVKLHSRPSPPDFHASNRAKVESCNAVNGVGPNSIIAANAVGVHKFRRGGDSISRERKSSDQCLASPGQVASLEDGGERRDIGGRPDARRLIALRPPFPSVGPSASNGHGAVGGQYRGGSSGPSGRRPAGRSRAPPPRGRGRDSTTKTVFASASARWKATRRTAARFISPTGTCFHSSGNTSPSTRYSSGSIQQQS